MSETIRVLMPMNPHQPDGNMVSLTPIEAAQAWRREYDAEFARRATADRLLMELAASGPADVRSRITDYFAGVQRPEGGETR